LLVEHYPLLDRGKRAVRAHIGSLDTKLAGCLLRLDKEIDPSSATGGCAILEDKGAHAFQDHPVAERDIECVFQITGEGDNALADAVPRSGRALMRAGFVPLHSVGRDHDRRARDLRPLWL